MFANCALAGDWPQWLGPDRDCSSPESIAPWKSNPKVLWRQPVGEGHSSPIVAAGKVFLLTKVKDKDEEEVQAFDAADGKPSWTAAYPRGVFTSIFGNGPRATPTFQGGKLYTFGVTGILSCLDARTGSIDWQVDTIKKFDAPKLFFGSSCSPLVDGNRVLVNVGAGAPRSSRFTRTLAPSFGKFLTMGPVIPPPSRSTRRTGIRPSSSRAKDLSLWTRKTAAFSGSNRWWTN